MDTNVICLSINRCIVCLFPHSAKQSVKAETQSMLSKLLPTNARQTHGNPPGLNKLPCQQISYHLSEEQQNKGEAEEYKSKQAEGTDSRSVGNQVSYYNCCNGLFSCVSSRGQGEMCLVCNFTPVYLI